MGKKKVISILISILFVFGIDRLLLMPKRLDSIWEFETGDYLGDPLALEQHFKLVDSKLEFKNGKKFYLVGCYFGELIMYNLNENKITRYSKH